MQTRMTTGEMQTGNENIPQQGLIPLVNGVCGRGLHLCDVARLDLGDGVGRALLRVRRLLVPARRVVFLVLL